MPLALTAAVYLAFTLTHGFANNTQIQSRNTDLPTTNM